MLKTLVGKSSSFLKSNINASNYSTQRKGSKVAVVLSGCGVFDGTEVHEAAATLVHLTKRGMEPVFYAPDIPQAQVMDHNTGQPTCEIRCVVTESSRIARGPVKNLTLLRSEDVGAVVFPGGFGVAKNLSTFATMGVDCTVNVELCRVIQEFHQNKKPMAFMCIAPILAARVIPNVKITLGLKSETSCKWPYADAIGAAQKMGAKLEFKTAAEVCVDKENLVLSTPAFMYAGQFYEIYEGIGNMIEHLECLMQS